MRGKEKCKALKEIRRQIAEKNDIPYVVSQCTHQGDCRGTCPKCEAELRYLERELAIRQGLGKAVAVVGISTSVCAGLTACSPVDMVRDALGMGVEDTAGVAMPASPEELDGDVAIWPESEQDETEPQSIAPEESTESQEVEDFIAGMLQAPDETEETEDLLMGEILPPENPMEETITELEGDIALPSGWEDSAASQPPMEESAP